jgi:hypothetical protein
MMFSRLASREVSLQARYEMDMLIPNAQSIYRALELKLFFSSAHYLYTHIIFFYFPNFLSTLTPTIYKSSTKMLQSTNASALAVAALLLPPALAGTINKAHKPQRECPPHLPP